MSLSSSGIDSALEVELSKERRLLLEKLSDIFDPETANDYVSPKTSEIRQPLSLEELRRLNYNDQDENLQRLRSLVHYKTTTESLSRADLEDAYQSFVRDQVAQQSPRYELEQFVRNTADIDTAKHYINMANDALVNPQQSLLLFRSSKLNEQKASLLKSSGYSTSLQKLNDDPSIQKYFTETLNNTPSYPHQDEEEFFNDTQNPSRPKSMHLGYNAKKYHVKFLKDYDSHDPFYRPTNNRHVLLTDRTQPRYIESIIGTDNNSSMHGLSSEINTSNIHREIFPPLSLAALKEYRPTVTPKPRSPRKSSSSMNIQQRRKPMRKTDFIWNQSMISSTKHQ